MVVARILISHFICIFITEEHGDWATRWFCQCTSSSQALTIKWQLDYEYVSFIHMTNFWSRVLNRGRPPSLSDLESRGQNEVFWSGTLHQGIHCHPGVILLLLTFLPRPLFSDSEQCLGWIWATGLCWYGLFKSKMLHWKIQIFWCLSGILQPSVLVGFRKLRDFTFPF